MDVLGKFSYLTWNVCCVYSFKLPHWGNSNEYTKYTIFIEDGKDILKLYPFASWPGVMINSPWLKLPMSRTNLHGPKDIRVIEVQQYLRSIWQGTWKFNVTDSILKTWKLVCFSIDQSTSKKEYTKRKEFTPLFRKGKINFDRVAYPPLKMYYFPLKIVELCWHLACWVKASADI